METINLHNFNPTIKMLSLMRKKSDLKNLLSPPPIQIYANRLNFHSKQFEKYLKLFDLPSTDFLPISYPFILTMPMQIQLFAHPSILLNPLGFLHVSNNMTSYKPISKNEKMESYCYIDSTRLVKKGMEIVVKILININSQTIWECKSTYLKFSKKYRDEKGNEKKTFSFDSYDKYDEEYHWHVSRKDAFSYAHVSGDYNLIHLSSIFARITGLPKPIIHGMWSIGKCLHYLNIDSLGSLYFYHVFKGPIPLNSFCKLCIMNILNDSKRFDLFVENNPRPCIQGIISSSPIES
ncbi:MAG: MaoC/PaaZ C-terminal domain-containing protein [Candidatus Hydrogenedens sp.]